MIEFNYTTDFRLKNESLISKWIEEEIQRLGFEVGDILYNFCDDETVYDINVEFLQHDTYTDIISFDYRMGKLINGEIFISVDRVTENAREFNQSFDNELNRVIIHGILHFCDYKDSSDEEEAQMRQAEDDALKRLNTLM